MSDERKDLPPVTAPNFLQRVRETLQIYLGSQGNALDRGLTVRDLADANVIKVNDAYLAGGNVNPVGGAGPAAGASTVVNNYTTTISYEPDLTKPPSPTGFTASAGLSYIYFQTDTPAFTAGHGFGQLRLYGAKYVSGALPTFSSAVELTREVAPLGSYPSSTGTNWRLWVTWVSKDGVESDPTGGTNGVSVTTGKIGNADLNSAIIEAANLASGAIDASKFTSTIEPVTLVTSVPGTKQTSTIFNTTDGKLYRWNGTAYVASVLTSDLSGTVTGSQIAANTITAGNLAAGSVTASKMFITGAGAALNADPNGTDATAWNGSPVMLTGLTDVPFGSTAIANAVGSSKDVLSAELIPVEQAKRYRIEALVKQVAGSGGILYLGVAWYDATGSLLVSDSAQPSGAGSPAGWSNGTYSYFGLIGAAAPGTWTRYVTSFGSGETCAIPSNAKFMRILALLNYSSSGGVQHAVTGFKVMEKADADLIVDGSIIASKLAANAIAVGTAAVQNGAIVNAMIGTTAIDDAKIANLSAAKLTAGDGTIGGDLKSSGFVAGSDGWIVRPNGTAEFGFAHIRGTLLASQVAADFITATMIDARGLSIKDASGNVILTAGSAIDWSRLGGASTNLTGLGYTGDLDATKGAPTGTSVGGSPAETVAVKALAALQKTGDTITGRVNMAVADGLFAGTDLSNGIYLGNSGLVGKKAGVTTFAVDTAGNAVFAGEIAAGSVDVEKLSGTTTTYSVAGTYTFTMPAGFTVMRLTVTGGGGGGGGGANDASWPNRMTYSWQHGSGGGQGGTYIGTFTGLTPGATYTVVVGDGGVAGGTNANIGVYNTPPSPPGGVGGVSSVSGPGISVSAAGGQPGGPGYFLSEYSLAPSSGGAGGSGGGAGYSGAAGSTRSSDGSSRARGGSSAGAGAGAGGEGYALLDNLYASGDPYYVGYVATPGQPGRVIIEAYNPNGIVKRSEWDTLITHLNARFTSYTWP